MDTKDKTFQKMFILKHSKFVSTLFIHFPQVIIYNGSANITALKLIGFKLPISS